MRADDNISPVVMCDLVRAIQPPMLLQRLNVRGAAFDATNDWRVALTALPALVDLVLASRLLLHHHGLV